MWKDNLCIVIAIDHYNPLGVIRSLGENGIRPIYISIKGKTEVASKSKYISKCYQVETIDEGYDILIREYGEIYKNTSKKPIIFCCDDKSIGFLDDKYNSLIDNFIFFNAGEQGRINKYINKDNLLQLAKKNGLKVLDYHICKRGELPNHINYPVITKSISSNIGGWKSDVFICNNEDDLIKAYDKIKAPLVIIQKYINKQNEYSIEGFSANKGNDIFMPIVCTYNYLIDGYYSPYMTVDKIYNDDLKEKLKNLLKEIKFEGVFEIEFLIDKDGTFYFLEINFRNSTWSYASTVAGMPLPVLWAETQFQGYMRENIEIPFDKFTAMVEPIDYDKRVSQGSTGISEWLSDFKESKCTYYYNSLDKQPWHYCVDNWDKLK